jgi:hypothetical protein
MEKEFLNSANYKVEDRAVTILQKIKSEPSNQSPDDVNGT